MENNLENANNFIDDQALFESGGIIQIETNELAALFVAYAASLQSEIVLPEYKVTRNIEATAWNKCIDKIKELNSIK